MCLAQPITAFGFSADIFYTKWHLNNFQAKEILLLSDKKNPDSLIERGVDGRFGFFAFYNSELL